jgi:hypothetical protein
MKRMMQVLAVIIGVVALSGCSTLSHKSFAGKRMIPASAGLTEFEAEPSDALSDRMIAWTASLTIGVWDVSNAVVQACELVEKQGGFVDNKSSQGKASAQLRLRVPTKAFLASVAGLEASGTVTGRDVTADDVTEQYVDVEARLKNKVILRDRLKQLLDKAVNVKDVLAIETELNRVQSDIDSMEGRIKSLKGKVDFATINLTLESKPVPGPLGIVFKGIGWGIKKLFVLRD